MSDKSRAFFLKNMLFSIMIDEKTSIQAHILKIKDIHDQLQAIGHTMVEEDMVVITLKAFPDPTSISLIHSISLLLVLI